MRAAAHKRGRRTAEVTAEHQVEDKEAVLVVLEGVAQIDDKRVVDLNDAAKQAVQLAAPSDGRAGEGERTSSSSRRSWMMFATAFILQHLALLMYLSASSCLVCLCWTTRTWLA